ncbi:MAG: pilus assembly protein PilP [Gammaproteobacteria bacterium]
MITPIRSRRLAAATSVAAMLALAGCVSHDMSDLESYVSETLARKGGHIDPLPEIKPYERYLYQAAEANKPDPFATFEDARTEPTATTQTADVEQAKYNLEIQTHNPEELEGFELDSLRMVGTMQRPDELWAIVRDSTGTVHRVQVGNYIGRNFGKILNIAEDRIELREIIKNANGNWEERPASLALAEE